MTDDPVGHDLTLTGLAERVSKFSGHIEDMSDEERVLLLGQFAGATSRLRARVRELYAKADDGSYMDALPPLNQVMLALGADEDWAEPEGGLTVQEAIATADIRPARLSADLTMSDGRTVHVPVVPPPPPASAGRIKVTIPYPENALEGLAARVVVTNEDLGLTFRAFLGDPESDSPFPSVRPGDTLTVELGEESLDAEAAARVLGEWP